MKLQSRIDKLEDASVVGQFENVKSQSSFPCCDIVFNLSFFESRLVS
jgi:hypothetical protein